MNAKPEHNEEQHLYGWRELTMIQASAFMSIPAMMVGFIMAKQYGFYGAVASTIIGHLIAALFAIPISIRASIDKKTSSMQTQEVLGKTGNWMAMIGLITLIMGWFSVELNITSKVICNVVQDYVPINYVLLNKLLNCGLGIFITFTASYGIETVRKVIRVSMCLFLPTMLFVLLREWKTNVVFDGSWSNLISTKGIMLVIGCCGGLLFDLPTFHRFAKSKQDSIVSNLQVFLFCLPMSHILGSLLYTYSHQINIATLLVNPEVSPTLRFWDMFFVVLSMCALNNVNLYMCGANSAILMSSVGLKVRSYIIGVLGISLACFNLADNFSLLLDKTLIIISCILAILILRAASIRNTNTVLANISVISGCAFGFAGAFLFKEPPLGSSYCASAIVTAIVYLAWTQIIQLKQKYKL